MNDKELFGCGCEDENCGCNHDEFDDNCECGCGDHEEEVMTITLEDGTEVDCAIIAIFPVEEKDYIALLPLDGHEEEGEVFLYEFKDQGDGIELLSIESDKEYELVTNAFDEILEEADLEELFDEDEEEYEDEEDYED
ncbi:MAG TPA: DUF1292 domain-containing protein [Sedimentibacter sp.]|nr:DUF1292 domain-containing protein [Sedimentibacter sp.]